MEKNISILLGAGFSIPMGYPTGNELNESLINSINDKVAFSGYGELFIRPDGSKLHSKNKISYDREFESCHKWMLSFKEKKGYFDYEEFYDYIVDEISKIYPSLMSFKSRSIPETMYA